jgi:putative PIG3 family NAD(P)H quinone oxidoreductase
MLAVLPTSDPPDPLPRLGELPDPEPGLGEVLVAVRAAGLNRADLLQLRGLYPPPPGESAVPGLELAGEVVAVGEGVEGWAPGRRVMALVAGGGQGELAAVPGGQLMALPDGLSFAEGAAIPEAGLTAWTNLVVEGGLAAGETVVISGANGGVGTFTVQLAAALGARVLAAGRDLTRLEPLRDLGAAELVLLDDDLPARARGLTGGRGADLVLDLVGGEHLPRQLAALAPRGRLILVGLTAGRRAELDLGLILSRRLRVIGSTLRPRPRAEKAVLVAAFADFALPRLAGGRLRPVIDRVFRFADVAAAYARMEAGGLFGKIVLDLGG